MGRFWYKIIGVDIDAINITEDREKFRKLMQHIGIGVAPSKNGDVFSSRK